MTRNFQSRLSDFGEVEEETPKQIVSPKPFVKKPKPERQLWKKTTSKDEEWGVCNFDDTVLFVQLIKTRYSSTVSPCFVKR